MTSTMNTLREALRRVFCPNRLERKRREQELLNTASDVVGTVVPWALFGAVGWAMISLMTGWNVGLL